MAKIEPKTKTSKWHDEGRAVKQAKSSVSEKYVKEGKSVQTAPMPFYRDATKSWAGVKATPTTKQPGDVILIGAAIKPESHMTPLEKMELIQDGISKKDLERLKQKTTFDYTQLAEVLSVARATLINKKGNAKFSPELSEKIVAIADIYSYGYEVFENESRFNEWICRPNQSLGGKAPYELLHSSFGREEIKNLIGRIDYGVYS